MSSHTDITPNVYRSYRVRITDVFAGLFILTMTRKKVKASVICCSCGVSL